MIQIQINLIDNIFQFYFSKKSIFSTYNNFDISINCQQISKYQQYFIIINKFLTTNYFQISNFMPEIQQNAKAQNENTYYYQPHSTNLPFNIENKHNQIHPSYKKTGHWTQNQKLRYGLFLICFRVQLEKPQNKRFLGLYTSMSQFVKTRNPNQCRSYHQKMETYFGSIASTIDHFNHIYPNLGSRYEENSQELQKIYQNYMNILPKKQISEINVEDHFTKDKFFTIFKTSTKKEKVSSFEENNAKDKELPPTGESYYPTEPPLLSPSSFMERLMKKTNSDIFSTQNPYLKKFPSTSNPYLSNSFQTRQIPTELGVQLEQGAGESTSRQKQWIQCHKYFIEWITRLNKLVSSQKSNN